MAVFGDYETVGDPLARSGDAAHTRTLWAANRRLSKDGRIYVIKSVESPDLQLPGQPACPGPFTTDPGAEFFASATRLKEAYHRNREVIAPIHGFGTTDAGVWYATDFYPRQSLAEYESSPGDLNDATLQHVVYSVASGCLALQKATGRSHGNLKASNVLRGGKSISLRKTQLRLIDAAGWPPSGPERKDDATLRQATEACDLRRIGELILQLVETNPIAGPQDYSLPIEPSVPWRVLGKDSTRWLDLCNRLLDPNLSLADISLESLAKDFRQSARSRGIPAFVTGVSLVLVAGIGSYLLWSQPRKEANAKPASTKTAASHKTPSKGLVTDSKPSLEGAKSTPRPPQPLPQPKQDPPQPLTKEPEPVVATDHAQSLRDVMDAIRSNSIGASAAGQVGAGAAGQTPTTASERGKIESMTLIASTQPRTADPATLPDVAHTPVIESRGTQAESKDGIERGRTVEAESAQSAGAISKPRDLEPAVGARPQGIEHGSKDTDPESIAAVQKAQSTSSTTPPTGSEPGNTESTTTTAASDPKAADPSPPVVSNAPIIDARPREEELATQKAGANTTAANATTAPALALNEQNRAPSPQGREPVTQQQPGSDARETVSSDSASPAERSPNTSANQAAPGNDQGKRQEMAKMETPVQRPSIDTLNKELKRLETEVGRAVALHRDSELFGQLNSLETAYEKWNYITKGIRNRLALLRANMNKKTPGPPQERPQTEIFIQPVVGK